MINLPNKKNKISNQTGFTLVEMIISLAIFTVVALVAVGALTKIMDANRKAINLKTSINNLNFALESMTREMRVGSNYRCGESVNNMISGPNAQCGIDIGNWVISFDSTKTDPNSPNCHLRYTYMYNSSDLSLEKDEQTSCADTVGANFHPIVSANSVKIKSSHINVNNYMTQPKIFLYLSGETGVKKKDITDFSLQTTISQRLPQ